MILQILRTLLAGWMPRHQPQVMTYLPAENRLRKAQLGARRPRLTDTARRDLAA
jgi:cytidylate kinase